jgi:hypothetical protein
MCGGPGEEVLLECRSIFWPVIIFPYYERSHTASVVGWKDHRPHVLKDVKGSFAGRVWLTEGHLQARSFLLRSLLNIKIPLDSIASVKVSEQDNGLIEIRYRQAELSRLLRFLTKGAPEGAILLKLEDVTDIWLQTLREHIR